MPSPSAGGRSAKSKSRRPTRTSVTSTRKTSNRSPAPRQRTQSSKPSASGGGGRLWLYGRHAVEAALKNPRRTCHFLLATGDALERLDPAARQRAPDIRQVERPDLDDKLGEHVVHQGLALAVAPLPSLSLDKACNDQALAEDSSADPNQASSATTVLVLDRINDPHNLGAILRSAAAFGARAVIVPHRQSAELGGATAKAASGALDMIPIVEVTNLTRTLEALKGMGYWRAGLDGQADQKLDEAPKFEKLALVLGAEGSGIRRLVAEHCDLKLRLPIQERMESLNVSVACGIALYALARRG